MDEYLGRNCNKMKDISLGQEISFCAEGTKMTHESEATEGGESNAKMVCRIEKCPLGPGM